MFIFKFFFFVAQNLFCLIDDAKLRRFLAHSKFFLSFFLKSIGQGPRLWTNRRNDVDSCPKEGLGRCELWLGLYPKFRLRNSAHVMAVAMATLRLSAVSSDR